MKYTTKRQLMRQIKGDTARISYYRMIKSDDFAELCYYYLSGNGLKNLEQFAMLADKLESSFSLPIQEGAISS